MTRQYLEQINPNDLKSMPTNKHIYGNVTEGLDTLTDSIKQRGILAPIVVTAKRIIADGHRRQAAAIRLGLTRVPCFVSERETVEEAIEDFLACQMTEREKTPEQMVRLNEYYLNRSASDSDSITEVSGPIGPETIEPEKPAKQSTGRPKKEVTKQEQENNAAKASGLGSRTTARKAAKVIKAIDEAEQAGDTETAEELRETLNTKSVHAAEKKLEEIQQKDSAPADAKPTDEAGKPIPDDLLEVFAKRDLFKAVLNAAKNVKAALNTLSEEEHDRATIKFNKTQAGNDLKNFLQQVSHAIPHAVCPYCKGKGAAKGAGCQVCKGAGWLVKSAYTSVPEDLR